MNAIILPIFLPFLTAALTLLWPGRLLAMTGMLAQLTAALWLVIETAGGERFLLPLGGWGATHGIVLVADLLSAVMVLAAALTALVAQLYSYHEPEPPLRTPLWHFLLAGVQLSFLTGDLFNLFVAFELILVASCGLLTLGVKGRALRHALPYLSLNLLGGVLFFVAAGMAYGLFGTLNFVGIAEAAASMNGDPRLHGWAALLLVVFALKAGAFPLYYWLPGAYPIVPAPVAAFFAGVLTKVGIYLLLRMELTILPGSVDSLQKLLLVMAVPTMLLGGIGALAQQHLRAILSFHIISQIGYMLLGIGLGTRQAMAAALFFVLHNIVVKSSLFLLGDLARRRCGSDDLRQMGDLARVAPGLALLFFLQAFALAGLPPLSGFWPKLTLLSALATQQAVLLMAIALITGLLTLLSMLKIWNAAFWQPAPHPAAPAASGLWAAALLVAAALALAFGAQPVLTLLETAIATAGPTQEVLP